MRMAWQLAVVQWLAVVATACVCMGAESSSPVESRYPVAATWVQERLVIACRNGVLATWNPLTRRLEHSQVIGKSLSSVVYASPVQRLFATDVGAHHMLVLAQDPALGWQIEQRIPTPLYPIAALWQEPYVAVACLWARQVMLYHVKQPDAWGGPIELYAVDCVDLCFAPGALYWDERTSSLLVADAFSDRLAIVNAGNGTIRAHVRLPGFSIRCITSNKVESRFYFLVSQVYSFIPLERDHVFWGNVVQQVVLGVERDQLFLENGTADVGGSGDSFRMISRWSLWPIGQPRLGSGDPEALVVTERGELVVALGGRNEVAIAPLASSNWRRVGVGCRPVFLIADASQDHVVALNHLDHSISVIEIATASESYRMELGKARAELPWESGERLFYDARRSLDSWMSCHTCHVRGHTIPVTVDTLGDATYGAPKRVLSLLGIAGTAPFAWNGSRATLLDQLRASVTTTMHGRMDAFLPEEWTALEHYVLSLPPAPGISAARRDSNAPLVERGRQLFSERRCAECHPLPYYTIAGIVDVGLPDEQGRRFFQPPSLLGVSQRNAWLHDARAGSLHDVFARFGHPHGARYRDEEVRALVAFLMTL